MGGLNKVIVDTDPGIDDILALLLALSSKADEIELLLISLTFGNIEVRSCLRNVVSIFHIIERELQWRRGRGQAEGFDAMKASKPIIAVGADQPLEEQKKLGDYFREFILEYLGLRLLPEFKDLTSALDGLDGLGGIHSSHPHLSPEQTWEELFYPSDDGNIKGLGREVAEFPHGMFNPSKIPSHQEILRILKENDAETITIVALGPLTNLALAAAEDPETFLRVKEVVVMGGCIDLHGNVTPTSEFNTFADATASARVFALTSPKPSSTMPPLALTSRSSLPVYPESLTKQLNLTLFPLDLTETHEITRGEFTSRVSPVAVAGSPLAEWVSLLVAHLFRKLDSMHPDRDHGNVPLSLHDPVCMWYAITKQSPQWALSAKSPEDIRIETTGQWTRGMCVIDQRNRRRYDDDVVRSSDHGHWLSNRRGNRINLMAASPGGGVFVDFLLERLFG